MFTALKVVVWLSRNRRAYGHNPVMYRNVKSDSSYKIRSKMCVQLYVLCPCLRDHPNAAKELIQ
jgi:hypothetical protein